MSSSLLSQKSSKLIESFIKSYSSAPSVSVIPAGKEFVVALEIIVEGRSFDTQFKNKNTEFAFERALQILKRNLRDGGIEAKQNEPRNRQDSNSRASDNTVRRPNPGNQNKPADQSRQNTKVFTASKGSQLVITFEDNNGDSRKSGRKNRK